MFSTCLIRTCLIRVRPRAQSGCAPTSPPPALPQGILLQARTGSRTQGMQARNIAIRRTNYVFYVELRRAGALVAARGGHPTGVAAARHRARRPFHAHDGA